MPPDTPLAPTSPTSTASLSAQSPTSILSPAEPPSGVKYEPGSSSSFGPVRKWELPPKPKPGRKPAANDPENKRKAQNRAAQRAFRERRAGKVQDLQEKIDRDSKFWDAERGQLRRDIDDQRLQYEQHISYLNEQLQQWENTAKREESMRKEKEDEIQRLQRQLADLNLERWGSSSKETRKSASDQQKDEPSNPFEPCDNCGQGGRCPCIEQMISAMPSGSDTAVQTESQTSPHDEMEIDFTTTARPRPSRHFSHAITGSLTADDGPDPLSSSIPCGFCTDESNCVCRAAVAKENHRPPPITLPQLVSPPESTFGDDPRLARRPPVIEPSAAPSGPGSCPSCLADPKRANFCRSLARLQPPPNFKSTDLPTPGREDPPASSSTQDCAPKTGCCGRMTCEDAYTTLSKDPNFMANRDSVAFLSKLRTEPPSQHTRCGTCQATGCSPYDVDAASVLTAMATGDSKKQSQQQ